MPGQTLGRAYVEIIANMVNFNRTVEKGAAEAGTLAGKAFNTALIGSGVLAVGVGVMLEKSIRAAGDFQAAMVRLTTSAGETGTMTSGNLRQVSDGILKMASEVGTSVEVLSKAMYTVESGSFHGAEGLKVLRAAAEGAKAENADLTMVTDAVTSSLVDYHLGADSAAMVTSKLVAATAAGKTTFQGLTGSLHSVLPAASAAHISLDDILGDLASMTLHGMSADQATQNLTDVIRHMQAPTGIMAKEFALLNIKSQDLTSSLSQNGLSGTLQMISDRIVKMMPPGSDKVILDMKTALMGLNPQVRDLGLRMLAGTISAAEFRKESRSLDVVSRAQAQSFADLAGATHRIGDVQTDAATVMQSYSGALQKATGDATGMNVALMLTGENSDVTKHAIAAVAGAATEAGNHVAGWGVIQETFNFKLANLKSAAGAAKIELGIGLLPVVTKLLENITSVVTPMLQWTSAHKDLSATIAGSLGAFSIFTASVLLIAKILSTMVKLAEALRLMVVLQWAWTAAMYAWDLITIKGAASLLLYEARTKAIAIATKAWAVVQAFLNIELWGNPIGLVILAIIALVAVIILCIKYHKQIADFIVMVWNKVWEFCHAVITKTVDFIKNQWESIWVSTKRIFELVVHFIENQWESIWVSTQRIFHQVVDFVVGVWSTVATSIEKFLAPAVHVLTVMWENMWAVIKLGAQVGWAILQIIFAVMRAEFKVLMIVIRQVGDVFVQIWHDITQSAGDAWHLLTIAWKAFAAFWSGVWHDIVAIASESWRIIRGHFTDLYDWVSIRVIAAVGILRHYWDIAWAAIHAKLTEAWGIIRQVFETVKHHVEAILTPVFTGFKVAISLVWDAVSNKISEVWGNIRHVFDVMMGFVKNDVPEAWRIGTAAIGRWWNDLEELAKKPVRFVINDVINTGVVGGLNWLTDHLGISNAHIDQFHPSGFAGGGQIPGQPSTRDNQLIWAASGEYVIPTSIVQQHGVDFFDALIGRTTTKSGRGGGFASGGIIGALESTAGDLLSLFTDPMKMLTGPLNALIDKIPGRGSFHDVLTGAGHKAVGWAGTFLSDKLKTLMSSFVGGGGSAPSGALAQWIAAAMAITGVPGTWAGPLNTLIQRESGGNPRSINLTDINAQNGDPSRGLMQTIGATFNSYRLPGLSADIYDPISNIVAGIRYILSRYGTIFNVQQANASLPPMGYSEGGLLSMDGGMGVLGRGWNLVHNGTGRLEEINSGTPAWAERLIAAVERVAPGVGAEINGVGRGAIQRGRAY